VHQPEAELDGLGVDAARAERMKRGGKKKTTVEKKSYSLEAVARQKEGEKKMTSVLLEREAEKRP